MVFFRAKAVGEIPTALLNNKAKESPML